MRAPEFWTSSHSEILINPRWPDEIREPLIDLCLSFDLPAHVWVASSGSTTAANESVKMIALAKTAICNSARAVNQHLHATAADRWALALPDFHVGGLGVQARAFISGGSVVEVLRGHPWNPKLFCEICSRENVTLTALVPAQVFDLVRAGLPSPASLRAAIIGGSALSEDLYFHARSLGWPLLPSFGMTEAGSQVATASLESLAQMEFPQMEVLKHVEVKTDRQGRLSVRGESLLSGFAQIRAGEKLWMDPKDSQGWWQTQDLVDIKAGYLRPQGRLGDFVKVLGEGVSLSQLRQRLESLMNELAMDFLAATVIALEDFRQGHKLIFVFENHLPGDLRQSLIERWNALSPPYEKIHEFYGVEKIERGDLGKIKVSQLLEKLRPAEHKQISRS